MNNMMKNHTKSLSIFILVNFFVFITHSLLANKTQVLVNIPLSYFANAVASFAMCGTMLILYKTYKSQIGFIFLGLSFIKMIALYFILSPNTTQEVKTEDSLIIFIPFFVNLILEQLFMIKTLNLGEILNPVRKD